MKREKNFKIRTFALIILLISLSGKVISQSTTTDCKIKISSPAIDGENVQAEGAVKGTAAIPDGYYLWALDHRTLPYKQQGVWWPQTNSEIKKDNTWMCWVTYGNEKDNGLEFEIAIIVVDQTEHLKLQAYVQKGDFSKPIKMPPTICPPMIRKVQKTSN